MTDPGLTLELRRLAAAVEVQAGELAAVRRLVARLASSSLPAPQQALLDALAGEFAGAPFASREMLAAARSPLLAHAPLRRALKALSVQNVQQAGHALRSLVDATKHRAPRLERCKAERGAAVWAVAGLDPE